jgi:peptide/nickel transport system ATP-binding protein
LDWEIDMRAPDLEAGAAAKIAGALVTVRDLTVRFHTETETVCAVNGVDLDLEPREVLCILGESGSGKSVLLRELMRLNPIDRSLASGSIRVAGHDMMATPERQLEDVRGKVVAMIFQDAMTAFDPVFTVGQQITETILRHDGGSHADARRRVVELFDLVHIPSAKRRFSAYPHELSGGLRQRAMIAMALSCRPELLLADEPTTALDATVQIQILLLLRRLQRELGMGVIFVTHDLGVAAEIADRVAIMYAGRFVEAGSVIDLMEQPLHPYTRGLLGATIDPSRRGQRLTTIPGAPPRLTRLDAGCAFAPRCPHVEPACLVEMPGLRGRAGRRARCIRVSEDVI